MKRTLMMLALGVALIGGGILQAQAAPPCGGCPTPGNCAMGGPGGKGMAMNPGQGIEKMADLLELTPEQLGQIEAIQKAQGEKVASLKERMMAIQEKMHQAVTAEPFDEKAVRGLADEEAGVRTEMLVTQARMRSSIHALLTEEQQKLAEKFSAFMQKQRERSPYGRRNLE